MTTSDESIAEPIRHTPVAGTFDVIVAGGGPAGIAAAVASSRNGATTLLLERYGFLGGMMTAGMVNSINGFRNQRGPNDRQAVAGIAQELVERIAAKDGAYLPGNGIPYCVVIDQEVALETCLELVAEAGCSLLLHTLATNPLKEGGKVTGIVAQTKAGRRAYRGKVTIDCTGDGDLASGAGVAYQIGRAEDEKHLPMQLMLRFRDVDMEEFAAHLSRNGEHLHPMYDIEPLENAAEAAKAGRPFGASGLIVAAGGRERQIAVLAWRGQAILWAAGSMAANALDPEALTRSEIESRKDAAMLATCLRAIPGFEEAHLDRTAPQIGIRETRHPKGEYVLTREDVLSGSSFDDSIAVGANPMACLGERPILEHDGFEIPLRCLLPEELDGLLLAGRCISATHHAHGSIRAMATCMATGQAAGTAAAVSIDMGEIPRYVSPLKVQERLTAQSAIVRRPSSMPE